jgi:hypothetical protein
LEKAGSDRRGSGNGLEAQKRPRVGANQPGWWSQKAERAVETHGDRERNVARFKDDPR